MFGKKDADVLVVGAGPVGLVTALTLARRGVSTHVIDKEERTGTHSYGLALHPRSLQLLDELGVLGPILDDALHVRRVGLYDHAEKRAELRLGELVEDYSFVAVMRQADLESRLEQALREHKVDIQWLHGLALLEPRRARTRVTVDRYAKDTMGYAVQHTEYVMTKSQDREYKFVLGTDGIYSLVRRRLEIGFPEIAPSADFAVFEFKTDADLGDEVRLMFGDASTNVCWPLPHGFCRWSFQIPRDATLRDDERGKERYYGVVGGGRFPLLTEARLREFLAERAPWFHGNIEDVRWRMEVRFENRLAESFGRWRTWLAGDAAHSTGPAGVQSMNVGLLEGRDLANAAADVLAGKAGSAQALTDYGERRRAEWGQLLGVSTRLTPDGGADSWIESIGPRLLPALPASGGDLQQLLGQVGLRLEHG